MNKGNFSSQATINYNTRHWNIITDWVYVDQDFRSDLGFIPRTGIFKSGNGVGYTFYLKKGIVNKHTPRLVNLVFWRPNLNYKKSDHELRFTYDVEFKNQATLNVQYSNQYIYLTRPFDPTRTVGGVPLPGENDYRFNQFSAEYQSNQAKPVLFNGTMTVGQFFTGNSFSIAGEVSLRLQPWALIGLNLNYDQIRLPAPHSNADFWLVTPRFDITFSKQLFWSTLVQYSNQRNNLGINSRLQWRFAPLSDLYLVYNDNYFTDHFTPRFRSINLKFSYWLNL